MIEDVSHRPSPAEPVTRTDWEPLPWDTSVFGFPVARTTAGLESGAVLTRALDEMRAHGVRLAYVAIPWGDVKVRAAAERLGGRFVDCKTTYVIDEADMQLSDDPPIVEAESYGDTMPDPALVRLARQSGEFSRFRIDPDVEPSVCARIYDEWLARSLDGVLADDVFVVRRNGLLAGMITVGERHGRGDIGLLAVDPGARRMFVGRALITRAHKWALGKGYRAMQVVTQRANEPACALYERCGYRVETMLAVFHHWF